MLTATTTRRILNCLPSPNPEQDLGRTSRGPFRRHRRGAGETAVD